MAMPASGCIALRTCITGINCSSISCAVTGSAQSPSCLSSLSVCAGKSTPHCMTEFYNFTPTEMYFCICSNTTYCPTTNASCSYKVACFVPNSIPAGNCFTFCTAYCICNRLCSGTDQRSFACVFCGATLICGRYNCAENSCDYQTTGPYLVTDSNIGCWKICSAVYTNCRQCATEVTSWHCLYTVNGCVGIYCKSGTCCTIACTETGD